MKKVIVVGGGAAGMMAAIAASQKGHKVILIEKNEKLGKKIYITGKGRGNLTNACDVSDFFESVVKNPRFLYSAIYGFTNRDMMDFMESHGIPIKVERGGRVFPVSDHASDITKALESELKSLGVEIRLDTRVTEILTGYENKVRGVRLLTDETIEALGIILATGGLSYKTTGSDGDGHRMLKDLGIRVTKCYPSLVSLKTAEKDTHSLSGLTLKNVRLSVMGEASPRKKKNTLYEGFGELLFTHDGISGPLALSASSRITGLFDGDDEKSCMGIIDLKPALDNEKLYERICRDIEAAPKREPMYLLSGLLPKSLAAVVLERLKIDAKKHLCDITKEERKALVDSLKNFSLRVTGTGDFKEAIITRGGVDVKEIDPSTMMVKNVEGLFVAGELLDVDALTGGYNLQIAFSTGHLAGSSV